jgi:DNA-binding XRE family transcriptional regulator
MPASTPPPVDVAHLCRGLAHWIRSTRQTLGLSQQQVADAAHLSQGAVSRLESGRHLDAPLVSYAKTLTVLCRATAPLAVRTPFVHHLCAAAACLDPVTQAPPPALTDPDLARLLHAFLALSPATKLAVLSLAEALSPPPPRPAPAPAPVKTPAALL